MTKPATKPDNVVGLKPASERDAALRRVLGEIVELASTQRQLLWDVTPEDANAAFATATAARLMAGAVAQLADRAAQALGDTAASTPDEWLFNSCDALATLAAKA